MKGKPGRKSTNEEVAERVVFILDCRLQGMKSRTDIFSAFGEKWPDISFSQFELDLAKAQTIIMEYHEKNAENILSELTMHLWELYGKSLKLQDYRECRAVLKTIYDITVGKTPAAAVEKPKRASIFDRSSVLKAG